MKMQVKKLSDEFRTLVGDDTLDTPDKFVISAINWVFRELPLTPKLSRIFSKHYTVNLDAKGHYKWNLNRDFRRIADIPMMNFWTSTGGDLCKLCLCNKSVEELYEGSIPSLMKPGTPCSFAIEQEDDEVSLVLDRPLDTPIVLDYIAYGFPKEVKSMEDTIEISAIVHNAMLDIMRAVWYEERDDFAFTGSVRDYLDNKFVPEMTEQIYKRFGIEQVQVLGG
jgi:hypothetical protein